MLTQPSQTSPDSVFTPEQLAALERLVSADLLVRAPRVHNVLRLMVDAVLAGQPERVNEQVIGEEVFQRPKGYSPAEDNIVRVTVSNLRARLDEFYQKQGKHEKWVFDIPKGKYVPRLRYRDSVLRPVPLVATIGNPVPGATLTPETPRTLLKFPWLWVLLAALAVMISGGGVLYSRWRAPLAGGRVSPRTHTLRPAQVVQRGRVSGPGYPPRGR